MATLQTAAKTVPTVKSAKAPVAKVAFTQDVKVIKRTDKAIVIGVANSDWMKVAFRTAYLTTEQVAKSGATDKTTTFRVTVEPLD